VNLPVISTIDWTAVAAGATALAAVSTVYLAWATRKLAKQAAAEIVAVTRGADATEAEAKVSARALQAAIRPWLSAVAVQTQTRPVDLYAENGAQPLRGYVTIENVGNGLAVIPKDGARVWGRGVASERAFAEMRYVFPQSSLLPTGAQTIADFSASGVSLDTFVGREFGSDFFVHVLYTDADGEQPVVASFRLVAFDEYGAEVFEIAYRRRNRLPELNEQDAFDLETPFAVVRVGGSPV
jgi:hypothetical protein